MIALVRHPAVAAGGRCYGRLDLMPDPADVAAVAQRLRSMPGIAWTSPARRCRAVAEALGAHRVDGRLQEMDFGGWEGVPWDDVPRAALDIWAADPWHFAPPGGESGAALVQRVRSFAAALDGGDHVVITHGGPLRVLIPLLRREAVDLMAPPPAPGSVTIVG